MLINQTPDKIHKLSKEDNSKGGLSKSPLKSISAKLRWMKYKGVDDEVIMQLHDMMVSGEAANFEVLKFILSMQGKAKTVTEREKVARLLLDWVKTHHGKVDTVNMLQVNSFSEVIINASKMRENWRENNGEK